VTDDTQAREALLTCPLCGSAHLIKGWEPEGWDNSRLRWVACGECHCTAPSSVVWNARSLPAAAAFLRANGYVVEEPKCKTCDGDGRVWTGELPPVVTCPTCSGTGARITQAQIDVIKELEAKLDAHMDGTGARPAGEKT
jgi:Zn finger protein HypA/HybF involved in hydrogenase expression